MPMASATSSESSRGSASAFTIDTPSSRDNGETLVFDERTTRGPSFSIKRESDDPLCSLLFELIPNGASFVEIEIEGEHADIDCLL